MIIYKYFPTKSNIPAHYIYDMMRYIKILLKETYDYYEVVPNPYEDITINNVDEAINYFNSTNLFIYDYMIAIDDSDDRCIGVAAKKLQTLNNALHSKEYYDPVVVGNEWISNIYINPDYRAQGIGRVLISKLLEAIGNKSVQLACSARNTRAIGLYRSLGFEPLYIQYRAPFLYNDNNIHPLYPIDDYTFPKLIDKIQESLTYKKSNEIDNNVPISTIMSYINNRKIFWNEYNRRANKYDDNTYVVYHILDRDKKNLVIDDILLDNSNLKTLNRLLVMRDIFKTLSNLYSNQCNYFLLFLYNDGRVEEYRKFLDCEEFNYNMIRK